MTDFAHTHKAHTNRQAKAEQLALAAQKRGFQVLDLSVKASTLAHEKRRELVRVDAGMKRRPSDETWTLALSILEARGLEATAGVRCNGCAAPVRKVPTEGGAVVMIDPFASEGGNVTPRVKAGRTVAVVLAGHDTTNEGELRFRQHQRVCPATKEGRARRLREAPKCTVCSEALDPELAYTMGDSYTTHPCCDPYGGGERDRAPTSTRKTRSAIAK